MGGVCGMHGRYAYTISIGQSEGKRPLRRHKHRWEDNVKIYFKEKG
jgi:hypothetical protein